MSHVGARWGRWLTLPRYDTAVINSFFALPSFLQSFGVKAVVAGKTKLVIPANYQAGLTNTAYVGQCIGLVFNGCQWPLFLVWSR